MRRDPNQAAHWYKKSYRNGYRDAALNLAIDRKNEGNFRSAIVWFKKAIAMKSGDAFVELAKIYASRNGGRKAAIDLLTQALRLGRDDISGAVKEQAHFLLKTFRKAGY